MTRNPLAALLIAACLAAASCQAGAPTTVSGTPKPRRSTEAEEPAKPTTDPAKPVPGGYFGRVLGLDGKPAANIAVAAIIANHGGGLVTDNGAGLVTDNGAGVIANNGAGYRLAQAAAEKLTALTDANGEFKLGLAAGTTYTVEAALGDDLKAIRGGVTTASTRLDFPLKHTGTIKGKVQVAAGSGVTNLIGVDVFIPGTSYVAKTDADGNFSIANVPVGAYKLYANKQNLGNAVSGVFTVTENGTATSDPITLSVPPVEVTAIAPAVALEGMVVTLTGTHFGKSTGAAFKVRIGGKVIEGATATSDTQATFTVPAGVTSGDLVVDVDGLASVAKPIAIAKGFKLVRPRGVVPTGTPVQLSITGVPSTDAAIGAPAVTWAATGAATIDATGKLTPTGAGTATVTAKAGDLTATTDIRFVDPANMPATLGGVATPLMDGPVGFQVRADGGYVLIAMEAVLSGASVSTAPTVLAGKGATGAGANARFSFVMGATVGPDGTAYVLDGGELRAVSPAGAVSVLANDGADEDAFSGLFAPMAVLDGNVYFGGDEGLMRVAPGAVVATVAATLPEDYSTIDGLAAGADGKLYALVDGELVRLEGSAFVDATPPAIARTGAKVSADDGLSGLAQGPDGTFYAMAGGRLVTIDPDGLHLIAGSGAQGGPVDGTGAAARFDADFGMGLTMGTDGMIYVFDESAVRRVDPATGVVTTAFRSGATTQSVAAKKGSAAAASGGGGEEDDEEEEDADE